MTPRVLYISFNEVFVTDERGMYMTEQDYDRKNDKKGGSKDHIPETTFIITCGVMYVVSMLLLVFG